jgi:hypothetical protein
MDYTRPKPNFNPKLTLQYTGTAQATPTREKLEKREASELACRSPLVLRCSLSFSGDIWYAGFPFDFRCSSFSFSLAEAENQVEEIKKK